MLATLTNDYFSDPGWIFEPKLDGVRCLAFKDGIDVRLLSRNKLDLSQAYPTVSKALGRQAHDFVIDGEIAAVKDGRTSFALLQQARRMTVPIMYFVFDIAFVDGKRGDVGDSDRAQGATQGISVVAPATSVRRPCCRRR
jgi:bifunctional non-homologous end joining protein LigD